MKSLQEDGLISSIDELTKERIWQEYEAILVQAQGENQYTELLITALDTLCNRAFSDWETIAAICYVLQRECRIPLPSIAKCIETKFHKKFNKSWIFKLIKAHEIKVSSTKLSDINSADRRYTLSRIPDDKKTEVFETGSYNGLDIRETSSNSFQSGYQKQKRDQVWHDT